MSKPLLYQDKPEKPKLEGYVKVAQRDVEWCVWAMRNYQAEFSVVSAVPGETKPVIRAGGEGITVCRALFDAAARCIDMGADRGAVIEALRIAVGGGHDATKVRGAALRLEHTHTRESKLKKPGAAGMTEEERLAKVSAVRASMIARGQTPKLSRPEIKALRRARKHVHTRDSKLKNLEPLA